MASRPIKPFIQKTETFVNKAPRRGPAGPANKHGLGPLLPPADDGRGPWTISMVKPHKRASHPTQVTFKRKVLAPNPVLAKQERERANAWAANQFARGLQIPADMVGNENNNNYPKIRRAKSAYARHLLGNFGPANGAHNANNNNLVERFGRTKIGGSKSRKTRKVRR
jgi:hypothetical protein